MVGGEIGNEDERFSCPLLLVVDGDAVGLDFRHANLTDGFLVGRGGQRASDYC
jgi:hypothetical protein